jgi:hypothetical protein
MPSRALLLLCFFFFTSFIAALPLPLAKRDSSDSDSKSKNGLIQGDGFEMLSECVWSLENSYAWAIVPMNLLDYQYVKRLGKYDSQ